MAELGKTPYVVAAPAGPDAAALAAVLDHLLTDVHEALRLISRHDKLLAEFEPMITAWRRTNGGTVGVLRARKAMRR